MKCRDKCGACCIVPSISSPSPKHPNGKKAGERCKHLTDDMMCEIFTSPDRPGVCAGFTPEELFCGESRTDAIRTLSELEGLTTWEHL